MSEHRNFSIGYIKTRPDEHLFLSVTPGFELGPGILRDGITKPRMTAPHSVEYVRNAYHLGPVVRAAAHQTEDPFLQRAGTWTLYQHVKRFIEAKGDEWQLIACQSCGDLTMNQWHVAYVGKTHLPECEGKLCALSTVEDPPEHHEPISERIYHSLIKWSSEAARLRGHTYEFLDIRLSRGPEGVTVVAHKDDVRKELSGVFKNLENYDTNVMDLSQLVEFTLAGKPIVKDGKELSLSNAIDRFQDVRHVFNLPTVDCRGNYEGHDVKEVNFGEYQFFHRLNERRGALQTAVIIDLKIEKNVIVSWDDVRDKLLKRHFRMVDDSPTLRGQFRKLDGEQVEIFYPHNVYPFGVLGLTPQGLVCLASGGLSGRVGNTLEGITRIMFDFFGCIDAMVLDEGYDTFQIVNPEQGSGSGKYKYTNDEILASTLAFTHAALSKDIQESDPYNGVGMADWPLNAVNVKEVQDDYKASGGPRGHKDILVVQPHRSQMRSVLLFAAKISK